MTSEDSKIQSSQLEKRQAVLARIRKRWHSLPLQSEELIQKWKVYGRP
ncbi:MAG: hypothetical protein AAFY57_16815 [Cyanobacteria bacterium J06642_2]